MAYTRRGKTDGKKIGVSLGFVPVIDSTASAYRPAVDLASRRTGGGRLISDVGRFLVSETDKTRISDGSRTDAR